MAVNKNFVVKNGLEVSTDLIFADASTEKVGIGSTIPATQLDVIGGIGASELNVTGVGTIVTLNGTTGIVTTVVGHNVQAGNLNITGITTIPRLGTLSELVISGVSTFNGDIDANADVAISGITTIGGNLGVTGVSTFNTFVSIGGSIFVSGISTFSGTIDANGNLDVDGYTELDDLNVSGVSTFVGAIDVNGISTFTNDITLTGSQAGVTSIFYDASANTVQFQDLSYLKFGAGSDLSIYHDGSNSYVQDTGTGDLVLQGTNNIWIQHGNEENALKAVQNAGVEIRYDNVKRIETASDDQGGGVIVTGKIVGTAATIGTGVTINNTGIDLGIGGVGIVTVNNITGTSSTITSATITSLVAASAKVSDLTDNRVVVAGTAGELEDNAALTFDGTIFTANNAILTKDASGIGATVGAAVGIVTYIGDGSQLIGLGIGIGGTGTNGLGEDGLVGYGFTQVNFIGSGVSEVSYNTSVGIATIWIAGGGGGTSGAATEITVADESADTTCFPIFAVSATGDIEPKTGSNITFNSSSGALTATSFVGDVTGDVTGNVTGNCTGSSGSCTGNAASSDTVDTTATSTDATYYPVFVDSDSTTSGETIRVDGGLTYNPSTNVLTATSFTGNVTVSYTHLTLPTIYSV